MNDVEMIKMVVEARITGIEQANESMRKMGIEPSYSERLEAFKDVLNDIKIYVGERV